MKAVNVKERLSHAREACFGLPEDVFLFTDYLAENLNEEVTPEELFFAITTAIKDLDYGFATNGHPVSLGFLGMGSFDPSIKYTLQVIEEVTPEWFAAEMRSLCEKVLDWHPTKRAHPNDKEKLAESFLPATVAAVEWWTTILQENNKGPFVKGCPRIYKEFTNEEMRKFRWTLANRINSDIYKYERASVSSDYGPDDNLRAAAEAAGMNEFEQLYLIPNKLYMHVTRNRIDIYPGSGQLSRQLNALLRNGPIDIKPGFGCSETIWKAK